MTVLLDRPICSALADRHAHLCQRRGAAIRYAYDFEPFVAAEQLDEFRAEELAALIEPGEAASMLERVKMIAPEGIEASYVAVTQLVAEAPIPDRSAGIAYRALSSDDAAQMYDLAHLTKPGPFRSRTHELGRFFGVFDGGKLVAMGGERMTFNRFTEISAVCTHPDYRGRGYGAALISAVGRRLQGEGRTPFLHSNSDNKVAMDLYQSLGFRPRAAFWHSIWEKAA